jgi:hypothetical protein
VTPVKRSLTLLWSIGYLAVPIKSAIGDLLAIHPTERQIGALRVVDFCDVQVELDRTAAEPLVRAWLRSGGRFECWGWQEPNRRYPHQPDLDRRTIDLERLKPA